MGEAAWTRTREREKDYLVNKTRGGGEGENYIVLSQKVKGEVRALSRMMSIKRKKKGAAVLWGAYKREGGQL